MSNYIPPYTISNKMLELVSDISEKVGRISSHKELESKPHLRRNNRIRSIHSSLKIEANSLSLSECGIPFFYIVGEVFSNIFR